MFLYFQSYRRKSGSKIFSASTEETSCNDTIEINKTGGKSRQRWSGLFSNAKVKIKYSFILHALCLDFILKYYLYYLHNIYVIKCKIFYYFIHTLHNFFLLFAELFHIFLISTNLLAITFFLYPALTICLY